MRETPVPRATPEVAAAAAKELADKISGRMAAVVAPAPKVADFTWAVGVLETPASAVLPAPPEMLVHLLQL
jgi:hypothetical protein